MVLYLEMGEFPGDERRAREIRSVGKVAIHSSRWSILQNRVRQEPTHCATYSRPKKLFMEALEGPFGGHIHEAKIHSELSRHYWWPGMRAELTHWCHSCLTCATRSVGRPVQPPLTPIPVAGPFDRVGVDVLQLPKTSTGNRYAVVFMDYLTKWPEVFATADQTAPTIARLLVEEIVSRHGVPSQLM